MKEGMYKVAFRTRVGEGSGLIVLSGGKLWGGDAMMAYLGTYTQEGDHFVAQIRSFKHTNVPGMVPLFGVDRVNITLRGRVTGDVGRFVGTAREAPGINFEATITKIEE